MFAFVLRQLHAYRLQREVELRVFFCRYKMSLELTNRFLLATTDYLTFLQGFHNIKF